MSQTTITTVPPAPSTLKVYREGLIRFMRTHPLGAIGAVIVAFCIFVAIFAPWLAPYGPKITDFDAYLPPGGDHFFGTDNLGRDIFSRTIWGARLSLYVGLTSVTIGISLGTVWGMVTAYFGGVADVVSQRVVDVAMGFPPIILALTVMAVAGQSVNNVIFALVILLAPTSARTMRAAVLGLKEVAYVEAAQAVGSSHWRVIFRHLLPNALGTYIVLYTVNVAYAIVVEAALSFLGVGTPPDEASWGGMLTAAKSSLIKAPWMAFFPGLAISLLVFGMNLFGDAIRDVTDAKMRGAFDEE